MCGVGDPYIGQMMKAKMQKKIEIKIFIYTGSLWGIKKLSIFFKGTRRFFIICNHVEKEYILY